MNIFLLSANKEKNAKYHCDRHIRKMSIEINQMLATALSPYAGQIHKVDGSVYKPCFQHHPCTRWVSYSRENFLYACELNLEICQEYNNRFNKRIGTVDATFEAISLANLLPSNGDCDKFAVAINNELLKSFYVRKMINAKDYMDLINKKFVRWDLAQYLYREYYKEAKQHLAVWTNNPTPEWFTSN